MQAVLEEVPAGFVRHDRSSPLTDPWEPLWRRTTDEAVILGVRIREAHCNRRGFAHGGLISSLADNAMGLSCGARLGGEASLVTVRLSVDFLASAQVGQWLQIETSFVKTGGTLCFTQAFITTDGQPCARADAVFRVVKR